MRETVGGEIVVSFHCTLTPGASRDHAIAQLQQAVAECLAVASDRVDRYVCDPSIGQPRVYAESPVTALVADILARLPSSARMQLLRQLIVHVPNTATHLINEAQSRLTNYPVPGDSYVLVVIQSHDDGDVLERYAVPANQVDNLYEAGCDAWDAAALILQHYGMTERDFDGIAVIDDNSEQFPTRSDAIEYLIDYACYGDRLSHLPIFPQLTADEVAHYRPQARGML